MEAKSGSEDSAVSLNWMQRHPFAVRFFLVAGLSVLLCVPLLMIRLTIQERVTRAAEVEQEIRKTWGGDQCVLGPLWEVPFRYPHMTEEWTGVADQRRLLQRREWVEAVALLSPEMLKVRSIVTPSERTRGLFRTTVYRADCDFEGSFDPNSLNTKELPAGAELRWSEAKLVLAASDWRGVDRVLSVTWGTNPEVPFRPRLGKDGRLSGLEAPAAPGSANGLITFRFQLPLQGSRGFSVVPVGRFTEWSMESPWPDPSFFGARLPLEREVTPEGFTARWTVSEYSQSLPHQAEFRFSDEPFPLARYQAEAFGVRIEPAVTPHRMAERAIKYGFLFVVFVLGVFFAFNLTGGSGLRTIHYLWVGLATCLFFLVLLALHEIWPFTLAYVLAAAVTTAMVVVFSRGLVGTAQRSWRLAATLSGVFGYLYVVLNSEDYALLAGSLALLVALGVAMRLTRSVQEGLGRREGVVC